MCVAATFGIAVSATFRISPTVAIAATVAIAVAISAAVAATIAIAATVASAIFSVRLLGGQDDGRYSKRAGRSYDSGRESNRKNGFCKKLHGLFQVSQQNKAYYELKMWQQAGNFPTKLRQAKRFCIVTSNGPSEDFEMTKFRFRSAEGERKIA